MPDTPINVHNTRVRSYQTDLNGAMYHGAFLDIFDDARIETFRHLGYVYADLPGEGWRLVIRRIECEYIAPAYMDEMLSVTFTVLGFTKATMRAGYDCRRDDVRIARGVWQYAFVDEGGKPLRVPARVIRTVEEHPFLLASDPPR